MTTVCLTGATGFIGKNLLEKLSDREDLNIVALSRKITPVMDGAKKGNVTWKRCNGFSLLDVEQATEGVDVLIYLIHSMLPSTSLAQGSFSDFDAYLADNFARAAHKNKIKKIIYVSGIIPSGEELSEHLMSRLEVENILGQYGNELTTLRAGLIIGKNGSSFRILERLVKRLPGFICPSWTQSKCQPISLEDVLVSIEHCVDHIDETNGAYDIGGPDVINYKEMLLRTGKVLGKKRFTLNVPLFSPTLSKLWVSKVTSTSHNLVYPLIDSLKHDMIAEDEQKLIVPNHNYKTFDESLSEGMDLDSDSWVRTLVNYNANLSFSWLKNVTSFQRVESPWKSDAQKIANDYFNWLPRFLAPFIAVKIDDEQKASFRLLGFVTLLILKKSESRSTPDRVLYYVEGGALARKSTLNGRLEVRWIECSSCAILALQDFRPRLPWFIYKYSQALVHLFVMNSFGRYLKRKSKADSYIIKSKS